MYVTLFCSLAYHNYYFNLCYFTGQSISKCSIVAFSVMSLKCSNFLEEESVDCFWQLGLVEGNNNVIFKLTLRTL